ncbi:protein of unknown function [Pseudomonas inefficax]|uniref:Uncharacterized protein n=1 Tax=Pseudomonas inefficax TaxID=2078786 RepID=A0AAQ1P3K4_9PSED|nr:protein of unknown function [Pseudomonas inefficax]
MGYKLALKTLDELSQVLKSPFPFIMCAQFSTERTVTA